MVYSYILNLVNAADMYNKHSSKINMGNIGISKITEN